MLPTHLTTAIPAGFSFNPTSTLDNLQLIALGVVVLALFVLSAISLFGPARKGNVKRSFDISLSSIISLFPIFLAGIGVTVFAGSFFGWFG